MLYILFDYSFNASGSGGELFKKYPLTLNESTSTWELSASAPRLYIADKDIKRLLFYLNNPTAAAGAVRSTCTMRTQDLSSIHKFESLIPSLVLPVV